MTSDSRGRVVVSRRRAVLLGSAAAASLAGCAGLGRRRPGDGEDGDRTPADRTTTPAPTTSDPTLATNDGFRTSDDSSTIDDATTTGESTTTDDPPADAESSTTEGGGEEAGGSEDANGTPTDEESDEPTFEEPSFAFAEAALPGSPGEHEYAVMGDRAARATATVFGNWKCPFTRQFVVGSLDAVYREFVRPGDLAVEFRAVAYRGGEPHLGPDAPRAARAGLAVWHEDPAAYWSYFGIVFANQPNERERWATTDRLLALAATAGVGKRERVAAGTDGERFVPAVRTTARVAPERGVTTVPRVVAGDEVTAPTVDFEATMAQLERAVGR